MVNRGEQKPGGVLEPRACGLCRGRRPASGQRLTRSAGRRSSAGYVAAGLAVLALLGAWSLGVVGCTAGGPGYARMDEASVSVLAGVRQSPGEISRLQGNAHYYRLMGRPELGLKEMELSHQQNPDNLQIVNLLAQNYEELEKFEAARQLYREALTRRGSHPVITNNLCFSYYQEGRWKEAETCFHQALAHDPNNIAARNNLGLLYCRLGRQDEARRLWQEAEGVAAADAKLTQALAALGMPDRPVYARRTESGPPITEATYASTPKTSVSPVATPAPAKDHTFAQTVSPKLSTPPAPTPAPVEASPRPEAVKTTSASAATATVTMAPAPVKDHTPVQPVSSKASTPPAPTPASVEASPRPEAVKVTPAATATGTMAPAPAKDLTPVQPVSPKALAPPLANKPPAKTPGPVAAKPRKEAQKQAPAAKPAPASAKATKASTPGVTVAPLAAPVPAAAPAPAKPRTPIKSAQRVAQSPAARTPDPVKALPLANILEAADPVFLTSMVEAMVLCYPKYLTCVELVCTPIEVRNGTWTKDLARHTRDRLLQEGFTVAKIGNHVDFGVTQTTIYYRPGSERVARVVASAFFPGAGLQPSQNLKKGMDVKILLGADLLQRPQLMARLVDKPK